MKIQDCKTVTIFQKLSGSPQLTTGKIEKKSIFLTCHFHEIYRAAAVGLTSSNFTLQIKIFVSM